MWSSGHEALLRGITVHLDNSNIHGTHLFTDKFTTNCRYSIKQSHDFKNKRKFADKFLYHSVVNQWPRFSVSIATVFERSRGHVVSCYTLDIGINLQQMKRLFSCIW